MLVFKSLDINTLREFLQVAYEKWTKDNSTIRHFYFYNYLADALEQILDVEKLIEEKNAAVKVYNDKLVEVNKEIAKLQAVADDYKTKIGYVEYNFATELGSLCTHPYIVKKKCQICETLIGG